MTSRIYQNEASKLCPKTCVVNLGMEFEMWGHLHVGCSVFGSWPVLRAKSHNISSSDTSNLNTLTTRDSQRGVLPHCPSRCNRILSHAFTCMRTALTYTRSQIHTILCKQDKPHTHSAHKHTQSLTFSGHDSFPSLLVVNCNNTHTYTPTHSSSVVWCVCVCVLSVLNMRLSFSALL